MAVVCGGTTPTQITGARRGRRPDEVTAAIVREAITRGRVRACAAFSGARLMLPPESTLAPPTPSGSWLSSDLEDGGPPTATITFMAERSSAGWRAGDSVVAAIAVVRSGGAWIVKAIAREMPGLGAKRGGARREKIVVATAALITCRRASTACLLTTLPCRGEGAAVSAHSVAVAPEDRGVRSGRRVALATAHR